MLLILRVVTYIAAALGGLVLFAGMASANGAPQEAAAAGCAAALVIIPYAVSSTVHRARIVSLLERRRD